MDNDQMMEMMLAAAFGTLSGMRAFSGPTLAALLRTLNEDETGPLEDKLNGQKPLAALGALALAEMIADKLGTGDRTGFVSLLARAGAGALAGALVCRVDDSERITAATAAGALAAIAAGFASFHLRRGLAENTGIPQIVLGMLEDGVTYGSGVVLLQQLVEE